MPIISDGRGEVKSVLVVVSQFLFDVVDVLPPVVGEVLALQLARELVVGHGHHVAQEHHERRVTCRDILRTLVALLRIREFLGRVGHRSGGDEAELLILEEGRVPHHQFHEAVDHLVDAGLELLHHGVRLVVVEEVAEVVRRVRHCWLP